MVFNSITGCPVCNQRFFAVYAKAALLALSAQLQPFVGSSGTIEPGRSNKTAREAHSSPVFDLITTLGQPQATK
jgi:hypothetical protein